MRAFRSRVTTAGLLLVLVSPGIPASGSAQESVRSELQPLTTPPAGVGRCRPVSPVRLSARDSSLGLRGPVVEITLDIGEPLSGTRRITAWVDSAGNVVRYIEAADYVDRRGQAFVHGIGAGLTPTGQVAGFHHRSDPELRERILRSGAPTDTAQLRALNARLFPPLDSTEQQRVRAMAEWVRRRCGAGSTPRPKAPKA
jgi:hypothetical protein